MENMITLGKDYHALINHLPLIPIRDRKHLRQATGVIQELALKGKARTPGETDYFRVLSKLVSEFEAREFAYLHAKMSHAEILASLLENSGINQIQLAEIIGISQARISDVINGKRELSKDQIARLCRHFRLSADLFYR